MFKILSVTNRRLCGEPLARRVKKLARSGVDGVILREKDLDRAAYCQLAGQVLEACRGTETVCMLHSFPDTARALGVKALHMPLPLLRSMPPEEWAGYEALGASCHSLEDVLEAAELGCTYVTLGHIFVTDCKKGVPPRGLELLERVCRQSPVPVCAIGGIGVENIGSVYRAGAAGACVMSGLMQCPDPAAQLQALRQAVEREENGRETE